MSAPHILRRIGEKSFHDFNSLHESLRGRDY